MADVGSLGQYKVVVTADYSQMQAQFKAMADLVNQTAKTMSQSLDNAIGAMSTNMVSQLNTMTNTMRNAFSGAEGVVRNFNSTIQSAGQTAETVSNTVQRSSEGFASYARQIQQAQAEIQNINRAMQQMRLEMARGVNPEGANVDAYRRLEQELQRVRAEYNRLRDTATQGERQIDREQQNTHIRQSRRISQLATQYRVAYEEINKYLQSHAKMSEAVFIRLQGRMTALGNELQRLGATPPMPNPLAGIDFDKYASQFGHLEDAVKSLKHHMTWMASAVAIGGLIGLPVVISEATKEFEALNTKIMQNLELANQYRGNHAALSADVEKLGKVAQDYAKGFGMSVHEVQEAMQIITRRFKDVNTATYLTGVALKMSRLDFVDTAKSARDLESVLLQFGMGAKEAGHFLNDFSVLLHTARINGTEMLDALERSGSAFRALNMNVSEAMAAIATLSTSTGLTGSTIGMTFKSIATNLDTKKGREALDALNIKLYEFDDTGKKVVRNGAKIILELQEAFKNLNEEGQRNLAYLIAGGKYQANAAMALLRDTGGNFKKFLEDMKALSSDAMTNSLLEKSLDTYATGIERFKASVTVLAQTIGGTLLPVMEGLVYAGLGVLEVLTQNADTIAGTMMVLGQLALAYLAVSAAMATWGVASSIVAGVRAAIMGVALATGASTVAMLAYNVVSGLATAASVAWGIASGLLTGNLTLMGLATVAASGAVALLDGALLPLIATVGAVIAVIALLGAALYEVVTNWDEYSGQIKHIWNELVDFISNAVEVTIDVVGVLAAILYGLYQVFKTVFMELVLPVLRAFAYAFKQIIDKITEMLGVHGMNVQQILAKIAGLFDSCVKWIRDNVSATFADFLDGTIGQLIRAAQKISQIAGQIQKAIKNAFTIDGDTSVSVEGGSVGGSGGTWSAATPEGDSWADFRKKDAASTASKKGFLDSFFENGLSGLVDSGKAIFDEYINKHMEEAFGGMMNDKDNIYAETPEMLRGWDDLGAGGGGAGSKGKGAKGRTVKEADNSIEAMLYRYLTKELKVSHNQAIGELANIQQESGFNYQANNGTHRGLYQMDSHRWGQYQQWLADTGREDSAVAQLDYRHKYESKYDTYEAQQNQKYLQSGAVDPRGWAAAFNEYIERSGEVAGDVGFENRMRFADELDKRFAKRNGEENFSNYDASLLESYKQLKAEFDRQYEELKTERAKIGQGVSASEKQKMFEDIIGVGKGNNPFKMLEEAQKDYQKVLLEAAKEEAKRQEAIKSATDKQVAAIDKMADAEVAFAEKLGLMSKKDVIDYNYRKNERNYATNKPLLDAKLGATVDISKGSYDDMLEAYRGLIYSQNALEAEHFAQKVMYLSRDVEATKKALDEEMKLEESYQQRRQELEREAYEYKARYTIGFIDSVANNFQTNLEAMLNGTKSFGEGIRDIFKGIINDIIKMFTEDLAKKLKGWLAKALHLTDNEHSVGLNPSAILGGGKKGKSGGFDLMGWATGGGLSLLSGGKKGGKGGGVDFGIPSIVDSLMPRGTPQIMLKRMTQMGNMMRTSWNNSLSQLNGVATTGFGNISNTMQVSTDAMGMTWENYTNQKVITNEVGDNAIVAQNQTTAATVQATTATMMSWLMLVLGLFALFGGSRKSKTSKSTSSENLGRAPESYYMTPMPVLQSTNYNVPSMDIGGNIERDMLIFAHKNEMVLTPEQADVIRNTARSGGVGLGNGGAGATVKSNIQVSTVDSKGFDRVLRDYNRDLSKQVKKGIRNGYLTAKGIL